MMRQYHFVLSLILSSMTLFSASAALGWIDSDAYNGDHKKYLSLIEQNRFSDPKLTKYLQRLSANPRKNSFEIASLLSEVKITDANQESLAQFMGEVLIKAETDRDTRRIGNKEYSEDPKEEIFLSTVTSLIHQDSSKQQFREKLEFLDRVGFQDQIALSTEALQKEACSSAKSLTDKGSRDRFSVVFSRLPAGLEGTMCESRRGSKGTVALSDIVNTRFKRVLKKRKKLLGDSELDVKTAESTVLLKQPSLSERLAIFQSKDPQVFIVYTGKQFLYVNFENSSTCTEKDAQDRIKEVKDQITKVANDCSLNNTRLPETILIPPRTTIKEEAERLGICNAWATARPALDYEDAILRSTEIHKEKLEMSSDGHYVWQLKVGKPKEHTRNKPQIADNSPIAIQGSNSETPGDQIRSTANIP